MSLTVFIGSLDNSRTMHVTDPHNYRIGSTITIDDIYYHVHTLVRHSDTRASILVYPIQ